MAALVAKTVFSSCTKGGINYAKVTISYTYGYNNDGVLGWTPGYTKYEYWYKKGDAMKENRVSNEFRQGREATFAALLMELCLCGERIASIMGIRNWYDQVGTVRIFLCILIFCYYYIIKNQDY